MERGGSWQLLGAVASRVLLLVSPRLHGFVTCIVDHGASYPEFVSAYPLTCGRRLYRPIPQSLPSKPVPTSQCGSVDWPPSCLGTESALVRRRLLDDVLGILWPRVFVVFCLASVALERPPLIQYGFRSVESGCRLCGLQSADGALFIRGVGPDRRMV